jgi:maltose alpha-D-glucosyltransferase/alpha-amylase
LKLLERRLKLLPQETRADAEKLLAQEQAIISWLHQIVDRKLTGMRIRCHGDYHLGQVLFTGKDFVIIDFEGEPARPISERRSKRSPLRDVAGMIRSFDYATVTALSDRAVRPEDAAQLRPWATFWNRWVSAEFLKSYLQTAGKADFMPRSRDDINVALNIFLLEKAVYEVGYELNNRPSWVQVPITGILDLLQTAKVEQGAPARES